MTFHSVDDNGRTAFADFSLDKPDEIPFFMPTDEVVTDEDMSMINISAAIESVGTTESSIIASIDAVEEVVSVFERLGIPQGDDSERYQ